MSPALAAAPCPHGRRCGAKVHYQTWDAAAAVLARIKARLDPRLERLCCLNVYECSLCGGYHLGRRLAGLYEA